MGLLFGPPGGLIMALPGEAERRAIAMGIYFTCYHAGMGVLLRSRAMRATSPAMPLHRCGSRERC